MPFCGPFMNYAQSQNLIEALKVNKNYLEVTINNKLKSQYLKQDFFVEYDKEINLDILDESIVTIPFVLNVVPIVWISGDQYTIDSMDEDLYHSLEKIRAVYQRMYPLTKWNGTLTPKTLIKNRCQTVIKDPERNLALLFSGGLDSTSSSYYHDDRKQLLVTAWGQWDVPLNKPQIWEDRKKSIIEFARQFGHANAFIRSNYVDFLNWDVLDELSSEIGSWRLDTTEGIGMMGLAAPILFIYGYSILRFASTYAWEYPYPSAANPLVDDNLIIAGGLRLKHDQFDFNRIQKIELIVKKAKEKGMALPFLKVCDYQRSRNCCDDCSKCIPTILGLMALGENPQDYGFEITVENATERAKQYIAEPQLYFSLAYQRCTRLFKRCSTQREVSPV